MKWPVRVIAIVELMRRRGQRATIEFLELAIAKTEKETWAMPTEKTSTNPKDAFGRQKPGMSDIPATAIIHESLAMRHGREKYGPYNWRDKTVSLKVYVDAMYRHIMAFYDGEEFDPESGVHHLGHVRAGAGIILDAMEQGTLVDDRPTDGTASRVLAKLTKRTGEPSTGTGVSLPYSNKSAASAPPLPVLRKKRVYIAGPMRGYPKFNFPAFDKARDLAIQLGFAPVSPADLDRESGVNETTSLVFSHKQTREFVRRDSKALIDFYAEDGDAIALLPGWEKSTGAVAEFFLARWLGLAVLDAMTMTPFSSGLIAQFNATPIQHAVVNKMAERK